MRGILDGCQEEDFFHPEIMTICPNCSVFLVMIYVYKGDGPAGSPAMLFMMKSGNGETKKAVEEDMKEKFSRSEADL